MWKWLENIFNTFIQAFKVFLKNLQKVLIEEGTAYLLEVARQAVGELATADLSNEAKRNEAFKRIKKYATTRGLETKDRFVNWLIESAVITLKAEF